MRCPHNEELLLFIFPFFYKKKNFSPGMNKAMEKHLFLQQGVFGSCNGSQSKLPFTTTVDLDRLEWLFLLAAHDGIIR